MGGFTRHLIGTFSTGCALASRRVCSLIFFLRGFQGFCIGLAHANQCYLTENSLFISVELRSERSESMGAMRHFVSSELVSSVPSHQAGFDSFAQLHEELAWSTDWKGTAGSLQCHFLVLTNHPFWKEISIYTFAVFGGVSPGTWLAHSPWVVRLHQGEYVPLFFPYGVFRVFVLGWRMPINATWLQTVSLYQLSWDQNNPKAWMPGAILRAAGLFAQSSLTKLVLNFSLTPVLSLPGQLTEKGL